VFKEKTPKSTEESLGGVGKKTPKSTEESLGGLSKDKKPSTAENFYMKFSQRVKNATTTTTSSPVT
jgi:hypothetical protein